MGRKMNFAFCLTIVLVLLSGAGLYGQSPMKAAGIILRGSFWQVDKYQHSVSISLAGEEIDLGPAGGWIFFQSRISERSFLEFGLGMAGKVNLNSKIHNGNLVRVNSLFPLVLGYRYHLLPVRIQTAIQPYLTLGGGAYWKSDVRLLDKWGLGEVVGVGTTMMPGLYGGAGLFFRLAAWLAINFDCRYHAVNLNPDDEFSGLECGLGFAFFWGQYRKSND